MKLLNHYGFKLHYDKSKEYEAKVKVSHDTYEVTIQTDKALLIQVDRNRLGEISKDFNLSIPPTNHIHSLDNEQYSCHEYESLIGCMIIKQAKKDLNINTYAKDLSLRSYFRIDKLSNILIKIAKNKK